MKKNVVIYSEELGVFVGEAFGLGFWSKLDPVGQDSAPVFDDEDQAQDWVNFGKGWPKDLRFVEVNPDLGFPKGASVAACVAAELPAWEVG
jgi:hypothetical protein